MYSKVREDEISELDNHHSDCRLHVEGGVENSYGKVNILLQTYISRGMVDSFSLTSDLAYVAQVIIFVQEYSCVHYDWFSARSS